jgi:hypothetical protein
MEVIDAPALRNPQCTYYSPCGFPSTISGAMYPGVPALSFAAGSPDLTANPKSTTFTLMSSFLLVSRMFSGFMSLVRRGRAGVGVMGIKSEFQRWS